MQRNASTQVVLTNGDLVANSAQVDSGVSARVFERGVWGVAALPSHDESAIQQCIDDANTNVSFLANTAGRDVGPLPRTTTSALPSAPLADSEKPASARKKMEFLRAVDAHVERRYPELSSRTLILSSLDMEKLFYNSEGASAHSLTPRTIVYAFLVTRNSASEPVNLGKAFGGMGGFSSVFGDPTELHEGLDDLHRHLMNKRRAVAPRAGTHDVVMAPELAGILAHEAIGHTAEADLVQAGSVAGHLVGKQVASPLVTLVDFAHTHDGKTLPVPVYTDDEGVVSEDTVLIDRGILQGFMHNKDSARHFGTRLTGNARAYRYLDEPLIRVRNTAILPGTSKLEDMISSVEDGYYLMWPTNGQADATSEFMFGVSLGYEIKQGKLGAAITDTTISGGVPNDRGDFSGIAKNSYFIEDGEIKYPVSEVMLSGNMARVLENVVDVSRERADFGSAIYPWVRVSDIGMS